MERRLVITAPVAYLAAAVPHPVFHAGRLEPLSAWSSAGLPALPGTGVVFPAALLRPAADVSACAVPEPGAYRSGRADYRPRGANSSS